MQLQIKCSKCSKVLKYDSSKGGRTAKCPSCQNSIRLPESKPEPSNSEPESQFPGIVTTNEPRSPTVNVSVKPSTEVNTSKTKQSVDLKKIAFYQSAIIYYILAFFLIVISEVALQMALPPSQLSPTAPIQIVIALLFLATSFAGMFFVAMLGSSIYGEAGFLIGILLLIPLIGLLAALFISSKATSILKANGYKVGLLGAKSQ